MAPSHRRKALALALAIAALWLPAGPVDAQTTPSSPQPASPDPNALQLRFGIEYWVRASNTDNFDFDGSQDDNINFGWHRIKPYFGLQKRWFELTLQGQDARSHNVPERNPNGTSTYDTRTSRPCTRTVHPGQPEACVRPGEATRRRPCPPGNPPGVGANPGESARRGSDNGRSVDHRPVYPDYRPRQRADGEEDASHFAGS